tara:strand:+ start:219 stop:467 length:249 start_codon:yes stop_codon:yes gene_type:complete
MKGFDKFIEEAAAKRCPAGKYWCFTDKKCKKIPVGYHIGRGGYLAQDNDNTESDDGTGKNGNGNGSSGGDSNGGSGNGGGGE